MRSVDSFLAGLEADALGFRGSSLRIAPEALDAAERALAKEVASIRGESFPKPWGVGVAERPEWTTSLRHEHRSGRIDNPSTAGLMRNVSFRRGGAAAMRQSDGGRSLEGNSVASWDAANDLDGAMIGQYDGNDNDDDYELVDEDGLDPLNDAIQHRHTSGNPNNSSDAAMDLVGEASMFSQAASTVVAIGSSAVAALFSAGSAVLPPWAGGSAAIPSPVLAQTEDAAEDEVGNENDGFLDGSGDMDVAMDEDGGEDDGGYQEDGGAAMDASHAGLAELAARGDLSAEDLDAIRAALLEEEDLG